jgi:hypothetical protein
VWRFVAEYWPYLVGVGGIGGLFASLRRAFPSLLAFLADAGTAPYLRTQNKALRQLLEEKTSDYDDLLDDYRTLAKKRRERAGSPDS